MVIGHCAHSRPARPLIAGRARDFGGAPAREPWPSFQVMLCSPAACSRHEPVIGGMELDHVAPRSTCVGLYVREFSLPIRTSGRGPNACPASPARHHRPPRHFPPTASAKAGRFRTDRHRRKVALVQPGWISRSAMSGPPRHVPCYHGIGRPVGRVSGCKIGDRRLCRLARPA